jgi:hypothetical protein
MELLYLYVIIIIIIIIGKDTVSFVQGIYTYIPETNHVPKQYNVAAILSLLCMVPTSLAPALALMYFYISTFPNYVCSAQYGSFCSSLTSWFPGMVLTYFLNDFEMIPVAPIIIIIIIIIIIHKHVPVTTVTITTVPYNKNTFIIQIIDI